MTELTTGFYVTGGTVPRDSVSYVVRDADERLFARLCEGEFCYVLTSRQMGKSSLMVRTIARLRDRKIATAAVDLSSIGTNVTIDQWYRGILTRLSRQLGLEDECDDAWREYPDLPAMQRWFTVVEKILLARIEGPIVLFFDELDAVQSLPFPTDELFAGIRACYNRRSQEPIYRRLTFCLLGVARPSELMHDSRTTPFNIGSRIALRDFTPSEAQILAIGIDVTGRPGKRLLERILFWTGGHPYLTQQLCRAVAGDPNVIDAEGVDKVCGRLFFVRESGEPDSNLAFVAQRLLSGKEPEIASLLDLYRKVRSGRYVRDIEADPLVGQLKIAGIVRGRQGRLAVSNQIYAHVFNPAWILAHTPGAELRRQQAAFRQGQRRAGAFALLIIGLVALTSIAFLQVRERLRTEAEKRVLRLYVYTGMVNIVQRNWEEGNVQSALNLLESQRPAANDAMAKADDLRGFEWRYLWTQCHRDTATLRGHTDLVFSIAYSPDGNTVASGGFDGRILLWDTKSYRLIGTLERPETTGKQWVTSLLYRPNSNILTASYRDGQIVLWDTISKREWRRLSKVGSKSSVLSLAFSPNGSLLAEATDAPEGTKENIVTLWNPDTGSITGALKGHSLQVSALAFLPDGKTLASGSRDKTVRLWNVEQRQCTHTLKQGEEVTSLATSPDGHTLAAGDGTGNIVLWNRTLGRKIAPLRQHSTTVQGLAFSPDGRKLVSASWDYSVRLWDVMARTSLLIKGHTNRVNAVAYSPDGLTLASGSSDNTVKLWNIAQLEVPDQIQMPQGATGAMALTQDGKTLASCVMKPNQHEILLWNVAERRRTIELPAYGNELSNQALAGAFSAEGMTLAWATSGPSACLWNIATQKGVVFPVNVGNAHTLSLSPNGQMIAVGGDNGMVTLWDMVTRQCMGELAGHSGIALESVFSPDGSRLAIAYDNRNKIIVWDVNRKQPGVALVQGHSNTIQSIAFSPRGDLLASCSWGGEIVLWNTQTGRKQAVLHGHKGPVNALAFSQDGRTLATGGDDAKVKLWNVATRQEVAVLKGHRQPIRFLGFSKDDSVLVSGDREQARIWQADTMETIEKRERSGF